MNREIAVAEVQQILGWRSDRVTEIRAALSYAQDEFEKANRTIPWFLLKEDQPLSVLSGNQTVSLPTDFIQEYEEKDGNLRYGPTVTGGRTFFLRKMQYEVAEKFFFGDWQSDWDNQSNSTTNALSPGTPKAYVLRTNSIKVYPTPGANYTLYWSYWGKAAAQQDGQANAWLTNAPWLLIGAAAYKLAGDLSNADAMGRAQTIMQEAEKNVFTATIHREQAGRTYSMGSRL